MPVFKTGAIGHSATSPIDAVRQFVDNQNQRLVRSQRYSVCRCESLAESLQTDKPIEAFDFFGPLRSSGMSLPEKH